MSMSNPDDSQFDDIFSDEEEISSEQQPRKPAANRGFMTLVGIIGGLMVLAVVAILFGIFFIMPQNSARQAQQAAVIYAANTATSMRHPTSSHGILPDDPQRYDPADDDQYSSKHPGCSTDGNKYTRIG